MTQWMIYTKRADFGALAKKYNIEPVTARIIINRGVGEEEFDSYINCDKGRLHSPWLFKDMEISVELIAEKIKEGKKIRVIGDYDIDGVCSTYILTQGLAGLGAVVDMDIPDRVKDGYGINISMIERAKSEGIDTIITCDNGIAAIEEINYARSEGMTVIVTDHHEIPVNEKGEYIKVNGNGVINPKQPDCSYPFKNLCGAGVAYKLMESLYENMKQIYPWEEYIEFAAIATIGDVVDLNGENRILAKLGLDRLRQTKNLGLKALMELNQIDRQTISSYHIGFIIGPCLNAGGRLETAKKAYELLCAADDIIAQKMAQELKSLNDERKAMTETAVEKAKLLAEKYYKAQVLVLYVEGIHESIAGIVAGRIREHFYKPVIILTDTEEKQIVKGSGRSIEGYDMFEKLSRCKSLFLKFGGHEMAAGVSMRRENIEEFRRTVNEESGITEEMLTEKLWIDVKLPFSRITKKFIEELSLLEPFGKGNEKPVFAEKPLELLSFSIMGRNRNVLKMTLKNEEKCPLTALYFGDIEALEAEIFEKYGNEALSMAKMGRDNPIRLSAAYYPQINNYNGKTTVQIIIKQIVVC